MTYMSFEATNAVLDYCRCRSSVEFAIKTAWLLDAFTVYLPKTSSRQSQARRLHHAIVSNELKMATAAKSPGCSAVSQSVKQTVSELQQSLNKSFSKAHSRSRSDATGKPTAVTDVPHVRPSPSVLIDCLYSGLLNHCYSPREPAIVSLATNNSAAGDLMSGKAFDNGCVCRPNTLESMMESLLGRASHTCTCCAPQLQPEMEFVNALMNIGEKLGSLDTKEKRSKSCLTCQCLDCDHEQLVM